MSEWGAEDSPDNKAHSVGSPHARCAGTHNAYAVGTPKMPGEPPRVQPSKKVAEHWDEDGNRIG